MTWDFFKKWLYSRNRVVEFYNKNSGKEVLVLWNGIVIAEWEDPLRRINVLYRSGLPTVIVEKEFVAPAKTIYEYPEYKEVIVGYRYAPGKPSSIQLDLFS